MLNPPAESDELKASNMMPRFWKLLRIFWDKDRVEKWHKTIMPDSQHPNTGVEGCFNQISLSPTAHGMWTRGEFALKPLERSSNRKELTVQFFWQVPGNYKINSQIDLLTEPASSEGLEIITKESHGYGLARFENDRSLHMIRSGETFTFTTKDPTNLPLPSLELLEMQWVLQRLVGMSGAAGWPSLDDDDDDDDTVDTDDDTADIDDDTADIDDDAADIDDSWLIPAD
jgi:HNH endonuclease